MTDGVLENHTGALLEPYCDGCGGQTDNHGLSYVDRELLGRRGHRARPPRLPGAPARHRRPGRAQRPGRRRGGPRRERSRATTGTTSPTSRWSSPRTCRGSAGSAWWPTPRRTGPRWSRRWRSTPSRSSAATGPTGSTRSATCCGPGRPSRWAATGRSPPPTRSRQIEVAVTRVDPGNRSAAPFLPEQALPLPVALAAFTAGSAYVNHDADGGSLRVGARADLAVLDRNLLAAGRRPGGRRPRASSPSPRAGSSSNVTASGCLPPAARSWAVTPASGPGRSPRRPARHPRPRR